MGGIPRIDATQIRDIAPLPGVRNEARVDPNPYGELGQAVTHLAGTVGALFKEHQDRADTAQLMTATSALSQAENHLQDPNNPDGVYAYQGVNAAQVHTKVLPLYDAAVSKIVAGLTNDTQKQRFAQLVIQHRDQFEGGLNSYALTQIRKYEGDAQEGFVQTSQDALSKALLTHSPEAGKIEANLLAGMDAFNTSHGVPSAVGARAKEEAISQAYHNVIATTAQTDSITAQAMFNVYGAKLTFKAASDISSALKPLVLYSKADVWLQQRLTGGVQPNAVPENKDQLVSKLAPIILRNETGGLGNAAATAVSPKGAVGLYQLEPATAAETAKRMGIPFKPADLLDPEKNKSLALEHLTYLCKKFGNEQTVLAAYNMGEGAAEAWAAGKPYHTATRKEAWVPRFPCDPDAMPTETRNYVSKGLAGGPGPARADVLAQIDAEPNVAFRRVLSARYTAIRQQQTADRQDSERALSESVYTKVNAARGSGKPLSVVLSPDEFAAIQATDKVTTLEGILSPKNTDTGSLTDKGRIDQQFYWAAGNGTPQQQAEGRKFIAAFDPFDTHKYALTNEQRGSLADQRSAFAKHDPKAIADVKDMGDLVTSVMYNTHGFLDHPKGSDADTAFNSFQAALTASIQKFKADPRNKGALPTHEQAQQMADILVMQTRDGHYAYENYPGDDTAPSAKTPGVGVVEVPATFAAGIRNADKAATDAEIRRAYFLAKARGLL